MRRFGTAAALAHGKCANPRIWNGGGKSAHVPIWNGGTVADIGIPMSAVIQRVMARRQIGACADLDTVGIAVADAPICTAAANVTARHFCTAAYIYR